MPPIKMGYNSSDKDSTAVSSQLALNCFLQAEPDGKNFVSVRGIPGTILALTLPTGPVRGHIEMGNALFVVGGSRLYYITRPDYDAGTHTTDLGEIAGIDRCHMAENGSQVCIVASSRGYIATSTTLVQITDADFRTPSTVDEIGGYFLFTEKDTGIFFRSELLDGLNYNALAFATATSETDNLVRVLGDGNQALLFGENTIEPWTNTGSGTFGFEQQTASVVSEGLLSSHTAVKFDNSIVYVNDDGIVQRLAAAPVRISSHDVEADIERLTDKTTLEAWSYVQKGHAFYVLSSSDWTWIYDASTQQWHNAQSGAVDGRWNLFGVSGHPTRVWDKWIVGDAATGRVGHLDIDTHTEFGETIVRRVRSEIVHSFPKIAFANRLSLDFEMGVGLTTGQGSNPQIMYRHNNHDSRGWTTERLYEIGPKGEYGRRVNVNRQSRVTERGRTFEVSMSDPVPFVLIMADLNGGPGV